MASKCQKFVPNMFNKSKCQHCFAAKEAHSTAALENNKASRKVSKCGYLFVSPGFDFNNPLDRSRRWQRRFFRLYDDGEFSYCVDENPDTVPQGFVDMNKCTDVLDAQVTTTHPYSLSIITPEKTLFIKGNSKEEIQWWHDVLAVFPKALKSIKPRRKQPCLILSNKDITADSIDGILTGGDGKIDLKSCTDAPAYATFKGVRSLKHKYDTSYQEGLRKSSSLHDLSSENQEMRETLSSTRYLSRSGDRLDTLTRESIYSLSRNTPLSVHKTPVPPSPWARSSSLNSGATLMTPKNVTSSHSSISSSSSTTSDRQAANSVKNVNGKLHRERSSSLRDFPTQFSIIRDTTDKPIESTDETDSNQTDELKDLVYTKKGWLIKQASTDKDSHKHWFVLAGNSLRYYEDAKAEESNVLEGRIDLSTCYEVSELSTHRNYGFKIKTGNGEYILAAMTLSIRNNWMKALRLCMEMHSSIPKWKLSANASHSQPRSAVDDLGFKPHTATSLTTANKGETAFQIVGHREPHKKEVPRPVRRHHSDVNPSNVSKVLSVKEFTASLEAESPSGDSSVSSAASRNMIAGALDALKTTGPAESTPKSVRLGNSREGAVKFKRDNTDSAAVTAGSGAAAQGPEHSQQNLKRNIASESTKEEVKRELMRHAKSPSARIKEKSRASKSSHSSVEEAYGFHLANALDAGSAMSDTTNDPSYNDSHLLEEDSEDYPAQEDTDNDEVGSATASDVIADDALVEILETEVETLKDRLEHTQTELDKIHKDNLDLKSRLHKESLQSVDSGYSSRWGGQNTTVSDNSQWLVSSTNNIELLKRQLKDAKDTNQRQKMDIEGLKGKLDMSVSKLTGTEKALSEALRDYKQEKDKFVKLSSEWNRRIRSMENQSKDTVHKLERSRETLQAKERECRRMEAELKTNLQKNREQEKEIVKLKAVEHEYNQLKEKLDDRDHELANLKSEMKEKDNFIKKLKEDYERQLDQLDREFGQERDDIEHHMEQLKQELYSAHDRQASMSDNMTSNIADILKEKDDIIAQLEEKMIEADKKLVDLSEELHAEMGENAELAHSIDMLQKDKVKLASTIEEFDTQLLSTRTKVSGLETENASLRRQLQELKLENAHLQESRSTLGGPTSAQADKERDELKLTVVELQRRLLDLQTKMEQVQLIADKKYERGGSMNSISSLSSDHHQDLLHNVLVVDSQLQEINTMMQHIHHSFDTYIESLPEREHSKVMKLSNLIEDVCHKCQEIQEVLREGVPHTAEPDYNHVVTVNAQSNGKIIMEEYLYLKDKFDHVVAELRKNKLSSRDHCKTCDTLRQEEIKLKEKLIKLESSCTAQVNQLLARVNKLGYGQPVPEATTHKETQCVDDIEKQLNLLEKQIITLEKMSSSVKPAVTSGTSTEGLHKLTGILQNVQAQVEAALTQAKQTDTLVSSTPSEHASVLSKLESCEKRIDSVVSKVQSGVEGSMACGSKELQSAVASGGVMNCLHEIRARVQEIGEQLDSLDEGDEDSDSENEGDQTTVEDIRDRLAQLTEYIEEHSKLTAPDWALLRLVSLQKESLAHSIESKEYLSSEADSTERKLKLFSDKLALEALILSEMGHILQTRDYLTAEDSVNREIDSLNNQVINLHQKLDNEMKTMHFEEKTTDVLSSYVELVAEKILINGQLCSGSFDKKSHVNKDISSDTPSIVQPGILAVEALLRCQLDSFIGTNLEKPSEEILDIPNHLTTHAIVQGELTFALKQLKSVLLQHPEELQPGSGNYQFMLSQLLQRQGRILGCFDSYFQQIVRSLAVIIFKESEEMTIVQGPETVLETMCSEISTVIERHIQHFKEKCRTAQNTHMAHKYDLIVNELRSIRETTLSEIKLKHEAYSGNQTSIRDSSLDIPVQSLDNTVANFGEILSLKAIMMGASIFIIELVKMGSSVLSDLELEPSDVTEENPNVEKGLFSFINILSQSLEEEALSKFCLSKKLLNEESSEGVQTEDEDKSMQSLVLQIPDLSGYSGLAELVIREAVHSAQLTFSLFKQKLTYECERGRTRGRRLVQSKTDQESRDSDDNLELQADIQALLGPMEEVLESKHEDELEVLEVFLAIVKQIKVTNVKDLPAVEEQLKQLEMKLQHEQEVAKDRHNTYLEVFKQESCKLEKTLEELQSDRDHYEERSAQLEDELNTLQLQHEEEKERVKKDILTAVHAIRSNDEKSEMHLIEKSSRMEKELAMQKVHFRKLLGSLKKDLTTKEKSTIIQAIEEHMKFISLSSEEEEEDDYQPPLPISPPPTVSGGITVPLDQPLSQNVQNVPKPLNITSHEQAVELLKREKEEALAEEIRNTKAALDAVRSAYEDELTKERDKYKEALRTMYTEDFINEIRLRNQEEEDKMREELQKLNMHYSSKCEDYKLMEMKLQQTKQDYESHISQLISSNDHLEELLNREIDSLKDFIKNKPSSLTTGSVTMEEELYDAKIMVRVKDTELQKLRSQVKNLENSLHRTTEEQKQTLTYYMQSMKSMSELKKQHQEETSQLTEKLNKVLGSQGLKVNIRRTPSFHQRARSPSPGTASSARKESDHSSRDSHRRRHIHPKDLRRSKSSPSLPFVFDNKGISPKQATPGSAAKARRSRSPKS